MRTNTCTLGLPDLLPHDAEKVRIGNMLSRVTSRLIRFCRKRKCAVVLENPLTSWIWKQPHVAKQLGAALCTTVHFCQFGMPWRKATRFASWHAGWLHALERRCGRSDGFCSRNGLRHVVLEGVDGSGRRRTLLAEPYPRELCTEFARLATQHFDWCDRLGASARSHEWSAVSGSVDCAEGV